MNTRSIYKCCIKFKLLGWCSALFIILCQASTWGASSVTLAWDAVTDANLAGYKVYYGTSSGSYSSNVSVSKTSTTATITGLQAGSRYYCVVKSYNTSGLESGPSNEINYLVPSSTTTTTTGIATFANANAITIPDHGISTPYPSKIAVANLSGSLTKVRVTLKQMNHTWPSDVGVLLVSPAGNKVILMSAAGGSGSINKLQDVTVTFDDAAASLLPKSKIASGTYKPTLYTNKVYSAPAPAGPYATTLSTMANTSPNGTWSLYVVDDSNGDHGNIAGGWSLELTTATAALLPGNVENSMRLTRFAAEGMTEDGPKPVAITAIGVYEDKQIGLTFQSEMNQHYLIEASSNHINWQPLSRLVGSGDPGHFLDKDAPQHPYRFYRIIRLPQ